MKVEHSAIPCSSVYISFPVSVVGTFERTWKNLIT